MKGPGAHLLAYGLLLSGLTVVLFGWRPLEPVTVLQLGGAAALCLVIAALVGLRPAAGERRGGGEESRGVPDLSVATVLLAAGVVLVVVSPPAGRWLALMGAGILALGAGGLVREARAQRSARRGRRA